MSESTSAALRSSKTTSSALSRGQSGGSSGSARELPSNADDDGSTSAAEDFESAQSTVQSSVMQASEILKSRLKDNDDNDDDGTARSDDGLGDDENNATNNDVDEMQRGMGDNATTHLQAALQWMRRSRCYLITVVCIFVIAIAIGAAPGALDLNNVEQYSLKPVIANRMRVKFALDSAPALVNTTEIFVAPLAGAIVTSAIVLNFSRPDSVLFDAQVEVCDSVNVTADAVFASYAAAFSNASFVASYGAAANLSVTLNRSRETKAGQIYTPFAAWITLLLVCLILTLLMQEDAVPPDVVLMLALVVMAALRIITVREALAGFANEGIATIGALYIIALAVGNSGALDLLSRHILGAPTGMSVAVARLMTPLTILSAFINNTPIVAMMAPVVVSWAQRVNMPASKLLIPLSYAAILGGTITVIGTSTNLIVKALVQARDPTVELPLFGVAVVGVPTAVLGVLYMVFIGHRILPARESPGQQYRQDPRAYSAHVVVKSDAKHIVGKTLGDAGLRHLTGLFVYSIERPATHERFDAPSSQFVLQAGDVIGVAGDVMQVNRLWRVEGLEMHADDDVRKLQQVRGDRNRLVEVVVAPRSSLVGRTPRDIKFRTRFNAAIVGLHRRGERVVARIGDVVLTAGDVLLLVTAGEDFLTLYRRSTQFSLVSELGVAEVRKTVSWARVLFVITLSIAMIVLASIDELDLSLFFLALINGYIFWVTGIVRADEARASVDISVMTMVAASIGLSSGMQNSGLALRIGTVLVDLFAPVGELGLLFGVYIATTVLNAFVSNSASVSLTFPIAYVIAQNSKVINVHMICYILMLAGSADFSTPIGYQTNLMVYSLGNYRFLDYTKVGMPLQLICCIVGCVIAYYAY
jgi:di/tricarboxylate transporter